MIPKRSTEFAESEIKSEFHSLFDHRCAGETACGLPENTGTPGLPGSTSVCHVLLGWKNHARRLSRVRTDVRMIPSDPTAELGELPSERVEPALAETLTHPPKVPPVGRARSQSV